MSSAGGKRKRKEDDEEFIVGAKKVDGSYSDISQKENDAIQKLKKIQNNIRCRRYREKKKNEAINLTIEEQEKLKRRQEQNKQNSRRYRNKKRTANLIKLLTNQNTVVDRIECENFPNSQIAGPSTINVPNVPPTHTTRLAIQNDSYFLTTDDDISQEENDAIKKIKKIQNNIRCKRYRDKKKQEALNSKKSDQTLSVEEQEKIKRRRELHKLYSKRYRDKKRLNNLINLQTNQNTAEDSVELQSHVQVMMMKFTEVLLNKLNVFHNNINQ